MKKSLFVLFCIFSIAQLKAQVITRQSGNYHDCFTWENQDLVGRKLQVIKTGDVIGILF